MKSGIEEHNEMSSFIVTAKNELNSLQKERDDLENQIKLLQDKLKKDQKKMAALVKVIGALEEFNGQPGAEGLLADAA